MSNDDNHAPWNELVDDAKLSVQRVRKTLLDGIHDDLNGVDPLKAESQFIALENFEWEMSHAGYGAQIEGHLLNLLQRRFKSQGFAVDSHLSLRPNLIEDIVIRSVSKKLCVVIEVKSFFQSGRGPQGLSRLSDVREEFRIFKRDDYRYDYLVFSTACYERKAFADWKAHREWLFLQSDCRKRDAKGDALCVPIWEVSGFSNYYPLKGMIRYMEAFLQAASP